ncbi:hypothetical protein [Sphingobacterium bovistauri]|nr:hypothetical protein [Sphingobacterium bovistauri]
MITQHKLQQINSIQQKYFAPKIEFVLFELEDGIATASTQIQIGGTNGTPQVTDWEEVKDQQFWDF